MGGPFGFCFAIPLGSIPLAEKTNSERICTSLSNEDSKTTELLALLRFYSFLRFLLL